MPSSSTPVRSYDVLVVGGGPAGIVAATQSAAAGAHTLLLERGATLGGTTVAGGVNFPGLFHAWGRQIIRGYGWRLVERTVTECDGFMPDFSVVPERHSRHQVRVDRAVYALLCDEMVCASGAELLFHALVADLTPRPDGWDVRICGKSGLETLRVGCVLDCTGDANVVAMAGGELRRITTNQQPGTYYCTATGYDMDSLDIPAINAALADALAAGEVQPLDIGWGRRAADISGWLRQHGENVNHIADIDAHDSWGRTRIELAGRASILRVYRFLRRQRGLEKLRLIYLAPECGVRETATIVGDATVTETDWTSGRLWPDALSYSFYPIDLHVADDRGLDKRQLSEGTIPSIPRGALLPRGLRRIAVAGRCCSSDRLANSALRVQGSAMGMGQAAGAMAALAVQQGCDLRELDLDAIRHLLRAHDAIVPPDLG